MTAQLNSLVWCDFINGIYTYNGQGDLFSALVIQQSGQAGSVVNTASGLQCDFVENQSGTQAGSVPVGGFDMMAAFASAINNKNYTLVIEINAANPTNGSSFSTNTMSGQSGGFELLYEYNMAENYQLTYIAPGANLTAVAGIPVWQFALSYDGSTVRIASSGNNFSGGSEYSSTTFFPTVESITLGANPGSTGNSTTLWQYVQFLALYDVALTGTDLLATSVPGARPGNARYGPSPVLATPMPVPLASVPCCSVGAHMC